MELYEAALERGAHIIVTSDMYFPSDVIAALLKENGYLHFEDIVVSCEYRKTKREGSLFEVLKDKYPDITPLRILHIGDNFTSDFVNPKKAGLSALYVGKQDYVGKVLRRLGRSAVDDGSSALDAPKFPCALDQSEDYQLGFTALGPLLLGFSLWLHKSSDARMPLVFLARDAYLLKKAYVLLYPDSACSYAYLSRRSTTVPLLRSCSDPSKAADIVPLPRNGFSLSEFLSAVGDDGQWERCAMRQQLDANRKYCREEFFADRAIAEFCDQIWPEVTANAENQAGLLKSYLKQVGIQEGAQIVDIGWHATIQKALMHEYGINVDGYYIGSSDDRDVASHGYLYDEKTNKNMDIPLEMATYGGFFETFFFAPHGTTLGYKVSADGNVAPSLGALEVDEAQSARSEEMQQGALDYVALISHSRFLRRIEIDPREALSCISKIGINPSLAEIRKFGSLRYLNFGKAAPLVPSRSTELGKDLQLLLDSQWKVGLIKSRLKLPFPYYGIYKAGRRLAHVLHVRNR